MDDHYTHSNNSREKHKKSCRKENYDKHTQREHTQSSKRSRSYYHSEDDDEMRDQKKFKRRTRDEKSERYDKYSGYDRAENYSKQSHGHNSGRKYSESEDSEQKYNHHRVEDFNGKNKTRLTDDETMDSEEEIMFDWENHRRELNILFFQEHDHIRKGTEQYKDFFKFLGKYQALQKQRQLKQIISNIKTTKETAPPKEEDETSSANSVFDFPKKYDSKHFVNFAMKGDSIDALMRERLPPRDHDDRSQRKRLPHRKAREFRTAILLYLNFMQRKSFSSLLKLRACQRELPIAQYRQEIVDTLQKHSVVLIAGDTGCGKSTQVPQYLMAAGYQRIACTQPRRIACISLCHRVAHETLQKFGDGVGYQIRFERRRTEHTKVLFLTEGLLLRQVSADPHLAGYDVVILDEIHERHLHTDFLLGIVKCLLLQRTHLKIILMSATINLSLFSNYFLNKAPVIQVPGRLHPISMQFFPIPALELTTKSDKINPEPYVRILNLIDKKFPQEERGDVLIFLSGFAEITAVADAARLHAQTTRRWLVLPLHSSMAVADQERVFDVAPEGVRKCIVSTNIAETSITIDGVRFVIDSGKVKEMSYDPVCKMQKLKEFWVSKASAQQRSGRSGRTGPGCCYRLYSQQCFDALQDYSTPEIRRVPLDSLVLQMVAMGIPDVAQFPFISPPGTEQLQQSVTTLAMQAALTMQSGNAPGQALTSTGRLLAQLPVDVSIGKMLLLGSLFHLSPTACTLAACLSVQSVFTRRAQHDPQCRELCRDLMSSHGDPLTLLLAFKGWLETKAEGGGAKASTAWCRGRGLEEQRFYDVTKLRAQFCTLLETSRLQETAAVAGRSAAERAVRHGEVAQLRRIKRQQEGGDARKVKVLRADASGSALSDDEDTARGRVDVKHLDFRLRHDDRQLRLLLRQADVTSFRDMIMIKVILTSGLYPNVAIADEHNSYKPHSDQVFHTPSKPFTLIHPTSVFASQPDVLELADSDIVPVGDDRGSSGRHPYSTRHQLLVYVSILETNKPFLMNTFRVAALQTMLLFSQSVHTSADFRQIVCDDFVQFQLAEPFAAINILVRVVEVRGQWERLLEMKLALSRMGDDDAEREEDESAMLAEAAALEKTVSEGLVRLFLGEELYSMRRLLAADLKVLYKGAGLNDAILDANPWTDSACQPNDVTGGVRLTSYLTYNSLLDVAACSVTTLTESELMCVYCDVALTSRPLAHLQHVKTCVSNAGGAARRRGASSPAASDDVNRTGNPHAKRFHCDACDAVLWLTTVQIFAHRATHR